MKKTIQVRHGTQAQLAAYALQEAEPGFTTDTFRLYIGDGTTNHLVGGGVWPADWDAGGFQITNLGVPAGAGEAIRQTATITEVSLEDVVARVHDRSHSIISTSDHTSAATSGRMLKADANGLPVDATNTDTDVASAVTLKHAIQHSITATTDHTSTATAGKILMADANGLPVNATNVDTDVADAVTKKHVAITLAASADTLLGLSTQELSLDAQLSNTIFAGPAAGGSYATWNPSDKHANLTLSGGNLIATHGVADGDYHGVRATVSQSTGKWYWEVTLTSGASGISVGIIQGTANYFPLATIGSNNTGFDWESFSGNFRTNNSTISGGAGFTAGDVVGIAVDLTTGKMWFSKNGTWQGIGDPGAGTNPQHTGISGTYFPALATANGSVATANFGASAFSYTVPTGFNSGFYSVVTAVPTFRALVEADFGTTLSPTFATVKLSGLTDDYIPYHVNDSTGLANGPTKTDVDDTITNKYPFWQILTGETVAVPARQQYSVFSRLDLQGTLSLAAGAELAVFL